jgi:DNA-directed RNA polymerase specialized sigma24 family protein
MGVDDLEEWLARDYAKAYRTACLVLRNPDDAEDAVQEAFLRVWRFRDAIPAGSGRTAWLYRVVVNACVSRIRSESARTGRDDGDAALAGRDEDDLVEREAARHLAGRDEMSVMHGIERPAHHANTPLCHDERLPAVGIQTGRMPSTNSCS